MKRQVLMMLSCGLLLVAASPSWSREWTDSTGKFSVEAELVEVQGEKVILKKADGSVVTVAIARLSETDQQYVTTHAGRSKTAPPHAAGGETSGTQVEPRRYPSFPDAVTRPPSWIGPDAPFDVAEFLATPPHEENAAPIYLDALFEFDPELSYCYHPYGEGPQGEARRRADIARQRRQVYSRLSEAQLKDPNSVDKTAVDACIAEYETGFEKLAQAQKRRSCVFETGMSLDSLVPHAAGARHVARVVDWRSSHDLVRGDFQRPIQGIEMVLRLSRDLRTRGEPVTQMVSLAMDNICCEQIVPAILTAPGVKAEHCDRLLAALARHEAEAPDPFLQAFRAEYLMQRKILHDLQHRTGSFHPRRMRESGMEGNLDTPFACLKLLFALGVSSGQLAREVYGEHIVPRTPAEALAHPLVAGWAVDGKLLSEADYAKEVDALNRVYQSILGMAGQTPLECLRGYADPTLLDPLRKTTLAVFLELPAGAIFHALPRAETILQGTKCLIALRRWQLEHGSPPPDLAALVQAAGMQEIPTDPYSEQPMKMSTVDGQTLIYSVGLDGKDDGGRLEWNYSVKKPQGDIVFRLPPSIVRYSQGMTD